METTWRATPVLRARLALTLLIGLLLALAAGAAVVGSRLLSATDVAQRATLITFDAERDIWVVREDGSGLERLTQTDAFEHSPVWSPDGTRIAYWISSPGGGTVGLMGADGTPGGTLVPPAGVSLPENGFVMWAPDGLTIGTHGVTGIDDVGVIVLWDVVTGVGHTLDIPIAAGDAAWSPDGRIIAFQSTDESGLEAIFGVAPDGTDLRRLTPEGRFATFWPADRSVFTPDSRSVVFQEEATGGTDGDIAIVGVDGLDRRLVVDGDANDLAGVVAPDGTSVAFIRDPGLTVRVSPGNEPVDLYVAPLEGSGSPRKVASGLCRCQPSWSPDGTRIASWTPDYSQLLVITVDGTSPPVSIPSPGNVGLLTWQPILP